MWGFRECKQCKWYCYRIPVIICAHVGRKLGPHVSGMLAAYWRNWIQILKHRWIHGMKDVYGGWLWGMPNRLVNIPDKNWSKSYQMYRYIMVYHIPWGGGFFQKPWKTSGWIFNDSFFCCMKGTGLYFQLSLAPPVFRWRCLLSGSEDAWSSQEMILEQFVAEAAGIFCLKNMAFWN